MNKPVGRKPVKAMLIAVVAIFLTASAWADIFDVNLLANPGGEAGPASPNGYTDVPVPGWQTNGGITVVAYTAGSGFPTIYSPGPPNRGSGFFAGGQLGVPASAAQFIDISAAANEVDEGRATCELSGYLGGFESQNDHAFLMATFLGATSNYLGSATIGPVTAEDRNNETGLLYRLGKSAVPIGTRYLAMLLQMTRWDGSYNDGYADDLAVVLRPYRPPLKIEFCPSGTRVCWPTNDARFKLETTTCLEGEVNWTNCPESTVIFN